MANGLGAALTDDTTATSDKTYYAQFEKTLNIYTITYKNVNGAVNPNPTSYTCDYQNAVKLVSPTRTGYTFGGWYETSDCSGSAVTQIYRDTRNNTFYADVNSIVADANTQCTGIRVSESVTIDGGTVNVNATRSSDNQIICNGIDRSSTTKAEIPCTINGGTVTVHGETWYIQTGQMTLTITDDMEKRYDHHSSQDSLI